MLYDFLAATLTAWSDLGNVGKTAVKGVIVQAKYSFIFTVDGLTHSIELEEKNTMNETKKVYETPTLVVHGNVEEITLGAGLGLKDLFVFGINDVIGRCKGNSCDISGS